MSDKMRGALFNMLGDIDDYTVLDAFSGTGALAFEAISRGAASALAIEQDRNAQRTLAENIDLLGLGSQVRLIKAGAGSWLRRSRESFDLILLDPPYDDLQYDLIESLASVCKVGGRLVLSWPGKQEILPRFGKFELLSNKSYGDGSLRVYERKV